MKEGGKKPKKRSSGQNRNSNIKINKTSSHHIIHIQC